jgi:hypothetical protein
MRRSSGTPFFLLLLPRLEKGVEEGAGKAQAESEGRLDRERRRR